MGKFYDFITRGQRRKIQAHISDVLSKTQVSGLSYSRAVTLLAYVPNEKEFKDHFDSICQNVDFFIKTQNDVLLKEISKSEIDKYEKVIAVKVFVVNDWDFYAIDNVAFYLKEDDIGEEYCYNKYSKQDYNSYSNPVEENFNDEDGFEVKSVDDTKCLATSTAKAISMDLLKYKEKTYFVWEEKK